MTFACSSRVKFVHLKVGSIYSLYICKISLWLTTPGLVKFHMPVQFLFAISIEMGSNSSRTVILFGIFTTFSYRVIFVMKLRGLFRSEEMGILTRRVQTFSKFCRRSSTSLRTLAAINGKFGAMGIDDRSPNVQSCDKAASDILDANGNVWHKGFCGRSSMENPSRELNGVRFHSANGKRTKNSVGIETHT